jgi:hypothetical protein
MITPGSAHRGAPFSLPASNRLPESRGHYLSETLRDQAVEDLLRVTTAGLEPPEAVARSWGL